MTPYELYIKLYNGKLPTERDPDYLELLRMSKYRILAVPDYKPGECVNCGSAKNDGRQYLDVGREIDWFGTIYFCGLCLTEFASVMGLFVSYENKIKELQENQLALDILNTRGVELTSAVATIFEEVKEYYANLSAAGVDFPTNSNIGTSIAEESSKSGTDTPEPGTEKSEPRTIKSTSGAGRKNVPSLTSLLDNP